MRLLIQDLSISSYYEPIFHFLADFRVSSLREWLRNHTYELPSATTDQQSFFSNQIISNEIPSLCLNIFQQHQQVYPNQNKNLNFHMPLPTSRGSVRCSYLILDSRRIQIRYYLIIHWSKYWAVPQTINFRQQATSGDNWSGDYPSNSLSNAVGHSSVCDLASSTCDRLLGSARAWIRVTVF